MAPRLMTAVAVVVAAVAATMVTAIAAPLAASELAPATTTTTVSINTTAPLRTVRPDYVSVTIDSSELVGDFWSSNATFPFASPRLAAMARALTSTQPAIVRVGGTEGDGLFYNVSTLPPSEVPATLPREYTHVVNDTHLSNLCAFASHGGFAGIVFGLNMGAGPRDHTKPGNPWQPNNTRALLQYLHASHPGCVLGFEGSNEPNLFPFAHGLNASVGGAQLAADYAVLRSAMHAINPQWTLSGPDIAWQIPILGEGLPIWPDFLKAGGLKLVQAATWHYYPLESSRCPLGGWPVAATPWNAFTPATLDMDSPWLNEVLTGTRDNTLAGVDVEVWLGEMALASCGGVDNITNAWAGVPYYVYKLAQLATRGHALVARQCLAGSSYALVDSHSLEPNPDYFSALLFKGLMGSTVLQAAVSGAVAGQGGAGAERGSSGSGGGGGGDGDSGGSGGAGATTRVFAHCTPANTPFASGLKPGAVTLFVLNVDPNATVEVSAPATVLPGARLDYVVRSSAQDAADPTVTLDVLSARTALLNGKAMAVAASGQPMPIAGQPAAAGAPLVVGPLQYAFAVFPEAGAAACLGGD